MEYRNFDKLLADYQNFLVIQAENPDGDSLGSALALEDVLTELGKDVILYCPVDIPKYLRYFKGWDRVTNEFNYKADATIIVDTASEVLLSKVLKDPAAKDWLNKNPVLVIDHHHDVTDDLSFRHDKIIEPAVATSAMLYKIFVDSKLKISSEAANNLLAGMFSDTLGLTTPNVTADTYQTATNLIKLGASPSGIEDARRELMKKSPEILEYKGKLIERIEYYLDGRLSLVHIPWEDIKKYSDQYNPNVLILEEMRMVTNVEVSIAIKTYPDGKLTGKVRTNLPLANQVAGYFGGGGHEYAAGFRVYDDYDKVVNEIINVVGKLLSSRHSELVSESDPKILKQVQDDKIVVQDDSWDDQ
ncbi:DHH family phosphoesterase [Candidatus Saccharibacteria bacterium]|nr:DHH family phosphoesterase [Candidatus Saccharibacteria bacterium]